MGMSNQKVVKNLQKEVEFIPNTQDNSLIRLNFLRISKRNVSRKTEPTFPMELKYIQEKANSLRLDFNSWSISKHYTIKHISHFLAIFTIPFFEHAVKYAPKVEYILKKEGFK
jgi:hypothetical protein